MKKIFFLLGTVLLNSALSFSQPEPLILNRPQPTFSSRKVQVAILFDASGSMEGLLSQAKSRIWNIVNELSSLRFEGKVPTIEIALYEYGKDEIPSSQNYVRQLVPLSTDLDLISEKLFSIRTNGGSEYCGAVIGKSLEQLNWSSNPADLKMIYIAGNEIFNQGNIDYRVVCQQAASRTIYVNTIYCGNYDQGVQEFWYDGAVNGKGSYFNIDASRQIEQIITPYDAKINTFNVSLNKTYYSYGQMGMQKKTSQTTEDNNALIQSPSAQAERSIVKSKANYNNASWDLIDADKEGKDINEIKEEDLPIEFQNKTPEEKTKLLKEKKAEREEIQKQISSLAKERQAYIDAELKKRKESGVQDDFGTSVNNSILEKSKEIGFTIEK